jgi:hypothetical protein
MVTIRLRIIYKKNIKTKKRRKIEKTKEKTRDNAIIHENTATNPLAYV